MNNTEPSVRIFTRPSVVEGPGFDVPNPHHVEDNTTASLVPDTVGLRPLSPEAYAGMDVKNPRTAAELSRDLGLTATSTIRWQAVLDSRR